MITALLCASLLWLSACNGSREKYSSRSVSIGDYTVEEKIYKFPADWTDASYERVYTVRSGWKSVSLGRYSDQASYGMEQPPTAIDDWLVVMSSDTIFFWKPSEDAWYLFWKPDGDLRQFEPYKAEGWLDYSKQWKIGAYDYHAEQVQIDGQRWMLEYRCIEFRCKPNRPSTINFLSVDGGQTFVVDE